MQQAKKFNIPYRLLLALLVIAMLVVFTMRMRSGQGQKSDHPKAVLEISKEDGIKLSEIAVKTIGAVTMPVPEGSNIAIPESALVYSLDQIGVYRLRNQWYKFITVKTLKLAEKSLITSKDLMPKTDQIVIHGSGLLRAAEMEAFGGEE